MRYKIKVYSIQEYGKRTDAQGRPHQEDSLFPEHGKATGADRLFLVCDGMGGHDAGEVASATVCEAMSKYILKQQPDAEGVFTAEDLNAAVSAAFDALDIRDTGAEKKMGTTMTALKLHDRGYTAAHIGDSRIYHIRPGATADTTRIVFRTEDHSLVNDLVRIGELTPDEAKTFSRKNVITRAMQPAMERRCKADIHESADIRAGDYFYLCTDGMLENTDDANLRWIFSAEGGSDDKKVSMLKRATDDNRDNHTAIIVHVVEVIDPLPVEEDATIVPRPATATPATRKSHERRGPGRLAVIVALVVLAVVVALAGMVLLHSTQAQDKSATVAPPPAATR